MHIGGLLNCCALEEYWIQDLSGPIARLNWVGDLEYIEKDCCLLNNLQHVIHVYKYLLLQKQSCFLVGCLKYCSLTPTSGGCLWEGPSWTETSLVVLIVGLKWACDWYLLLPPLLVWEKPPRKKLFGLIFCSSGPLEHADCVHTLLDFLPNSLAKIGC